MFQYNPQNGRMTLDKYPVGTIERTDTGFLVSDVRDRQAVYTSMDDAFQHFHNFSGWKEYVGYRDKPKSRTVHKNKEVKKRWALT
jgi:hypothetical protein